MALGDPRLHSAIAQDQDSVSTDTCASLPISFMTICIGYLLLVYYMLPSTLSCFFLSLVSHHDGA